MSTTLKKSEITKEYYVTFKCPNCKKRIHSGNGGFTLKEVGVIFVECRYCGNISKLELKEKNKVSIESVNKDEITDEALLFRMTGWKQQKGRLVIDDDNFPFDFVKYRDRIVGHLYDYTTKDNTIFIVIHNNKVLYAEDVTFGTPGHDVTGWFAGKTVDVFQF